MLVNIATGSRDVEDCVAPFPPLFIEDVGISHHIKICHVHIPHPRRINFLSITASKFERICLTTLSQIYLAAQAASGGLLSFLARY